MLFSHLIAPTVQKSSHIQPTKKKKKNRNTQDWWRRTYLIIYCISRRRAVHKRGEKMIGSWCSEERRNIKWLTVLWHLKRHHTYLTLVPLFHHWSFWFWLLWTPPIDSVDKWLSQWLLTWWSVEGAEGGERKGECRQPKGAKRGEQGRAYHPPSIKAPPALFHIFNHGRVVDLALLFRR